MKRYIPFLLPFALVVAHVVLLYRAAASHTRGEFTYPLDDTYIHMALAHHIAFDGVYGVTRFEFTPAASSIVWPWLLALLDRAFGEHVLTPLMVNVAAAAGLVWAVKRALDRLAPEATTVTRTFWVVVVVIVTPLSTLVIIGMEHTLHAMATVLLATEAAVWLARDQDTDARKRWRLVLILGALGALDAASRYEGCFLVALVCGLGALRHRLRESVVLGAVAAVPVLGFGLWSMLHGGRLLPNSVLLKGHPLRVKSISDLGDFFGGDLVHRATIEPHLFACVVSAAILLLIVRRRLGPRTTQGTFLVLAIGTTLAHMQFANLEWFFRYEAYTVTLTTAAVGVACARLWPSARALLARGKEVPLAFGTGVAVLLLGGALMERTISAASITPMACANIYDQQVQSARFLERFFPNEPVVVNDIGAVAYMRTGPIVDLMGLASIEVARARHYDIDKPLERSFVAQVAARSDVAVVYDEWFPGAIPSTWTRLGRWSIDFCRSCAFADVSIYATRPEAIPRVAAALRAYAPGLPEDVDQAGWYVNLPPHTPGEPTLLGEGDVVSIEVPGNARYTDLGFVGPNGRVAYRSLVRGAMARGRTPDQLANALVAGWKKSKDHDLPRDLQRPHVRLITPRAMRYTVSGNVFRWGDSWTEQPMSVSKALARAGGPTAAAKRPLAIYLWHQEGGELVKEPVAPADLDTVLIDANDILVVP